MNAWLRAHRDAFANGLHTLIAQPIASLMTLLAIGVTLALPAFLWTILHNGERLAAQLPLQPQLTLFLKPNLSQTQVRMLQHRLQTQPTPVKIRYIPKEEALKALLQRMDLQTSNATLPTNPLPDALVLTYTDPQAPQREASRLLQHPEVAEIVHDSAWITRLSALIQLGRTGVWCVATLLALGFVLLIGNTVRLQTLLRRDEIEVSLLFGATHRFIRRPFLFLQRGKAS